MTGISGNNSLYNFGHHPYAPYAPPTSISLIEPDRSRICSPTVPVDLFSVHPSSTLVKYIFFNQIVIHSIRNSKSFQVCKATTENTNTDDDPQPKQMTKNTSDLSHQITNDEPAQTPKMDQMNHISSTAPSSATDRVFTVDRFIAPALRSNNRTLSA